MATLSSQTLTLREYQALSRASLAELLHDEYDDDAPEAEDDDDGGDWDEAA
jgi:hypothetical protein